MNSEALNYAEEGKYPPGGNGDGGNYEGDEEVFLQQPEQREEDEDLDMDEDEEDADTSGEQPQDYQENGYDQLPEYSQQLHHHPPPPHFQGGNGDVSQGTPVDGSAAPGPADPVEIVVEPPNDQAFSSSAPNTSGEATTTTSATHTTTPPITPDGKPESASTPKSLKERISEIPARLSRFSLLNALRSGTYVVSEPKAMSDTDTEPRGVAGEDEEKAVDNGGIVDDNNQEIPLTKMDHAETDMSHLNTSKKCHSVHRSALTKLLCGLYALLLVVFGIVFSVANALTVKERQHLYYLEVFLIYLYLGSLVVLIYFQFYILRGVRVRNNYFDNNIRVVIRRDQLTPSPTRKQDGEHQHIIIDGEETFDSRKEPMDQMSTLSTRSQMAVPADGSVAHVGEGINFYLRLGALAFSIGSVTLDGFHVASYFETENTTTCESYIFTVVYLLHLIFTFIQTFFLFKNHKLVIDKNKASVRFGLMHLLATNLAVWFVTAITETAEDFKQQSYFASRSVNTTIEGINKSCYEDITLARTASPYLFPCTIIYSIIAAGIVYRMYQYVGVKVTQRWPSHTSLTSSVPAGAVGMDCEKANKGLFTGLLVAVVTLIAIATFFVFESRLNHPHTAIKIFFIMEISLIIITGSCIIFGMLRFVQLKFLENYLSLDAVLLVISLGGAYVYLCFMLISSASMVENHGVISILSLAVICVGILESTLQAIFILDGLCRRAENDLQVESKPGRAVVTFLLVCNLALWVVSMFEIKKTMVVPFHLEFYGILPWNIMLHLCVPLFIYFRFHSAICLSKIWYHAYQKERNP
ncbi:proton channel OtopLc-like isoform X2 [Biomphalaria glabrata]|uniref:Proton channel OtopLc-like isoform X2 n=1 Tax=Biomphalaria glabrata TaxID=6526 RepID=A0A9U8E6W6_BIOGL|nr:proton channel OtopLc-like isoform X2 [Biomphalaria glabrata]